MDTFIQVAEKIIQAQIEIIGPIALEQAKKIPGLKVDWEKREILLQGDSKNIIEQLVEKYKVLFGQASVEVCREAAKNLIAKLPKDQIPPLLVG